MRLDINCYIDLPSGSCVIMTAKEVLEFHDDLTKFINDNWEALKEKD